MRAIGSTVISRDSIVWPSVEGGSKREIKGYSRNMSPIPSILAVVPTEALPMLGLSLLGSLVFLGLLLCVRRFDAKEDAGGDSPPDGGGGSGPRPDRPQGPLRLVEPPLGEIRASRRGHRSATSRKGRERATAPGPRIRARG
jgi:hypothetical protein